MSEFDPLRAAREELNGINEVLRVLEQRHHKAEEAMAMAEQDLSAIRKILGYVRIAEDTLRARIADLVKSSGG